MRGLGGGRVRVWGCQRAAPRGQGPTCCCGTGGGGSFSARQAEELCAVALIDGLPDSLRVGAVVQVGMKGTCGGEGGGGWMRLGWVTAMHLPQRPPAGEWCATQRAAQRRHGNAAAGRRVPARRPGGSAARESRPRSGGCQPPPLGMLRQQPPPLSAGDAPAARRRGRAQPATCHNACPAQPSPAPPSPSTIYQHPHPEWQPPDPKHEEMEPPRAILRPSSPPLLFLLGRDIGKGNGGQHIQRMTTAKVTVVACPPHPRPTPPPPPPPPPLSMHIDTSTLACGNEAFHVWRPSRGVNSHRAGSPAPPAG